MDARSLPGIAEVFLLRGAQATAESSPSLLVEVPHGADRTADYDALAARLTGELPAGLVDFFHVNTDVGAWDLGVSIASAALAAHPTRSALLVRCLLPRTFVDTNRKPELAGGDLKQGGMTAGIPTYIKSDADRALLLELHAQYTGLVASLYAEVCGPGGLALIPHSYAPRSVGIAAVDDDIVQALHRCYSPELEPTWPLRHEVDLLTATAEGERYDPPGAEEHLLSLFAEHGFEAAANATYSLHSATMGFGWAQDYRHQVLTFELRRDLLMKAWQPFEEMHADPMRIARASAPIVAWLTHAWGR